ncbi:MAG: hypothetical protein Q4A10_06220 [Aerococcaceae bacterium]|nr:hypothetical protein [Aerococcaceae bacterium]
MRNHYEGLVTKTKLLSPEFALVKIQTATEAINAYIGHKALTFLMNVEIGDQISIFGHYNHRKQLIIERYWVRPKKHDTLPPHLHYPHRKPRSSHD